MLVDAAAMKLIAAPRHFEVIVTENMFGDILSPTRPRCSPARSACCPTASLGGDGPGLFEPVHGSAPDIAGQGIANPLGDDPLRRADAAPRTRPGGPGGCRRIGGRQGPGEGHPHRRPGRNATTAEVTKAVLEEL